MNKHTLCALAASFVSICASADPFGAPPDATHAWAVHDDLRPGVRKISADGVKPPSDAVVLFDGTAESIAGNWRDAKGNPTKWTLSEKGELVSVSGAGYIYTKAKFSDCQLHVEWASPSVVSGRGQGRGNSGVFFMGPSGGYEIQVLDSYETDPFLKNNPNPNYPDGQAGAVYGQNPPLVNPCRAPGAFNTYDIVFHAPRFNADGSVRLPASITVFFNGVLVQDNWKFDGPTGWRRRAKYPGMKGESLCDKGEKMSIAFQDHGNPVRFRNVWAREIPRPDANVTHGKYYAKKDAVEALRAKTADRLEADFDAKWKDAKAGRRLFEAWRVAAYKPTKARLRRVWRLENEFLEAAKGVSKGDWDKLLGVAHWEIEGYYDDLARAGLVEKDDDTRKFIKNIK